MNRYTFYIEGCGTTINVLAETEKEAHKEAWELLSDEQKDHTVNLDCIECVEHFVAMSLIVFVGDWVYTSADNEWHLVVDCDGGMYAKLDNGFWVYAEEPEVEKVLSAREFAELLGIPVP